MINIIITCTPNYEDKKIISTVSKSIDIVSQTVILCNSIKKNWNFDYKINLFHNESIPFKEHDIDRIQRLNVDLYGIKPDSNNAPYMLKHNALCTAVGKKGSHRLLLDCDTIALNQPNFNLKCDWQAMFAGSVSIESKYYNLINSKYDYNVELKNKKLGNLFLNYLKLSEKKASKNFFPHFNGGALLIKEDMCKKYRDLVIPACDLSSDNSFPENIRHIGIQYAASFALMKISDNWQPFDPGFNYLVKLYDVNKFGKQNIQLLHYCGRDGFKIASKDYRQQIFEYLKQQ
jgi:hypothetical protein